MHARKTNVSRMQAQVAGHVHQSSILRVSIQQERKEEKQVKAYPPSFFIPHSALTLYHMCAKKRQRKPVTDKNSTNAGLSFTSVLL